MRPLPVLALPTCLGLVVVAMVALGATSSGTPAELGRVDWGRDISAALEQSRGDGRPIFLFFQEVPGCQTCVSFGEQVLGHPLLVEAIETSFRPVFVYNNRKEDQAKLSRFGEPSWNNPVVRFVDAAGADLIPRSDGIFTPDAIGRRMIAALEAAGRPVPAYLREALDELRPHDEERVAFGMHCYWSGEACLGDLPGVLSTRAGYLNGSEAVEVVFDVATISLADLAGEARRRGCAERMFVPFAHQEAEAATASSGQAATAFGSQATRYGPGGFRLASPSDQKRNLRASPLRNLDLTPRQSLRVNAALARGADALALLSPRQRSEANRLLASR